MLIQFCQGNELGKLFFCGFNGEGEVNVVKLFIDGIFSNDNVGGMFFLGMLFLFDIVCIEVVCGINDVCYGLYNIVGNVNIVICQGGNYDEVCLIYGSFNMCQVQVVKGVENGNWLQNYFVGYEKLDGYCDYVQVENIVFFGKWFYISDDGCYCIGLSICYVNVYVQELGYLMVQDVCSNLILFYVYVQFDGGNCQMDQVSLYFDGDIDDQFLVGVKFYLNCVCDQCWLCYFFMILQQECVIDEIYYGLLINVIYCLCWKVFEGMSDLVLEGGFSMECQEDQSLCYNMVNQVCVLQMCDYYFVFDMVGVYVQVVIKLVELLCIIFGYWVDYVGGCFNDFLCGVSYGIQDYGYICQFKLSVVYVLICEVSLYVNWGCIFQVGVGVVVYKFNNNDLCFFINDGWEIGVKFMLVDWFDGCVVVWEQCVLDEVK